MEAVRYEAPGWGIGEVWTEGRLLLHHEAPRPRVENTPNDPQGIPEIPVITVAGTSSQDRAGSAPELAQRFASYFAGKPDAFDDVELDLSWCTPFQLAALEALRRISRGETVTYGELAALAGHPNAQRAAGSFCAANRFALVVPCHRVVAADGLGPYGSLGPDYKRRLLELEGADVAL